MGTKSPGTVQKTRFLLSSALLRLLEKHSFKSISIGDICTEAMVSRSAFYLHFADKYELLSCLLNDVMKLHEERYEGMGLEARLSALLQEVQNRKKVMYNAFMADPSHETLDILSDSLKDFIFKYVRKLSPMGNTGAEEVAVAFYAGGLAGIITFWIRSGFARSVEEVAVCMVRLLTGICPQPEKAPDAQQNKISTDPPA